MKNNRKLGSQTKILKCLEGKEKACDKPENISHKLRNSIEL
jgi:hypothetical protein